MGKDPVTGDKVAGWQRALNALPYIKQLKKVTPLLKVSDNITIAGRTFKSTTQAAKYKTFYDNYGSKVANAIWDAGKGGANKLATALNTKAGEIAHHLIPTQLIEKSKFVQKAINEGFDFNGAVNGLNIKFPGKHPDSYWQGVNKMIEETKTLMPKASAKEVMESVAGKLKTMIQNNKGEVNSLFKN